MSNNESKRPFGLDLGQLEVDHGGVKDFFWPVPVTDLTAMRDSFHLAYTALVRPLLDRGEFSGEVLGAILPDFTRETMSFFQAQALVERLDAAGYALQPTGRHAYWDSLARGEAVDLSSLYAPFRAAFPGKTLAQIARKPFKSVTKLKSKLLSAHTDDKTQEVGPATKAPEYSKVIHNRKLTRNILDQEIVTTKRGFKNDIINVHAVACGERVTMGRHKFWFRPVSDARLRPWRSKALPGSLLDEVMQLLVQAFAAGGVEMSGLVARMIKNLLVELSALTACHLDLLHRRPERLPKRLWTGTGGHYWDCLLRLAVKRNGGHVTGHDHAWGPRYVVVPYALYSEFLACDKFLTYTDFQAEQMHSSAQPELLLENRVPEVVSVGLPIRLNQVFRQRTGPIRKVMVVNFFLETDIARATPFLPDMVAVDFEARLLGRLREFGYQACYKPHPESRDQAPLQVYQQVLGAQRLSGNFEDVLDQADAVIFLYPNTTTFTVALRTSVPIVFVDLDFCSWRENVYEKLVKRCAIVKGYRDEDNRVQVDWEDLRRALEQAPKLADNTEFVENCLL